MFRVAKLQNVVAVLKLGFDRLSCTIGDSDLGIERFYLLLNGIADGVS